MKIITVEKLSKIYPISSVQNGNINFREMLFQQVTSFFKRKQKEEVFYALKDVSFEVDQGEVLGIIGKNGSGKSTLLKILSRITAPTSGKAIVRGRVASLLEVGTGFHPELTGRENIFMNGIILGMKRWEVLQHFDEIVSFAGVEQFLDVPVKKYSSGMRLRLAFSIAAHLQPEILVIDEVLAVGDYEFEKKCLKLMEGITQAGRTIIFVSHNIDTIKRLCTRVIWMNEGSLLYYGESKEAINKYVGCVDNDTHFHTWKEEYAPGNEYIKMFSIKILNKKKYVIEDVLKVELEYKILKNDVRIFPILSFYNQQEVLLFRSCEVTSFRFDENIFKKSGYYKSVCSIPAHTFEEGLLYISVVFVNSGIKGSLIENNLIIDLPKILSFYAQSMNKQRNDIAFKYYDGLIRPNSQWKMHNL